MSGRTSGDSMVPSSIARRSSRILKLANVSTGAHVDVFPCELLAVSSVSRGIAGGADRAADRVSGGMSGEGRGEGEDCHGRRRKEIVKGEREVHF